VSSWSRRVSTAASRQALRDAAVTSGDASREPGATVEAPAEDLVDRPDEQAERLSGEQIRTVLTDTLVETPDMVAVFASVGREALWANDAFVTVIPIRASDKLSLVELLDEWSRGHFEVKVLPALVKFGRWRGRLTFLSDGGPLVVSAVLVAHRDESGEIATVSLMARDLRELRSAEEHLSAAEKRFVALVENVADLIAVVSAEGTIEYVSPAASGILGHGDGELEGSDLLELIHPDDLPEDLLDLARTDEQGIGAPVELRLRARDGGWRHLEVIASDLRDNPAIAGIVLNARDVTERVESARELANRAYTDPLTGLPNRVRFLDRITAALVGQVDAAGQEPGSGAGSVVVLVGDIDRFKPLNAMAGQDGGDDLLRQVADRLEAAVDDQSTVARIGGDAFAVVLPGAEVADAVVLANRIHTELRAPLRIGDREVELTLSLGIAASGEDDGADALLQRAELAMIEGKRQGGDRTELFGEALAADAARRDTVDHQLRRALEEDGLRVHFQPIIDLETDQAVGAEALLRVHDDDGVLLSPAAFVDAAESNGLISQLGLQVLEASCGQLAAWAGLDEDSLPREVSVNVSPRQLADPDLPAQVQQVLRATGVAPERLCLEITESILISAEPTVDASISYLRSLGVRIGLDDFGTGQSSLGYLKRFPLDFVKIDQSLVAGLGVNEHDTAIVRATVELAHNLGLLVIAVGVETEEQLEALSFLGCDRAQGHLFAPALPADELPARLAGGLG
jgi:diguanylate cyclase (GGDEF)-like protein/PAS domain S-box-containing protein